MGIEVKVPRAVSGERCHGGGGDGELTCGQQNVGGGHYSGGGAGQVGDGNRVQVTSLVGVVSRTVQWDGRGGSWPCLAGQMGCCSEFTVTEGMLSREWLVLPGPAPLWVPGAPFVEWKAVARGGGVQCVGTPSARTSLHVSHLVGVFSATFAYPVQVRGHRRGPGVQCGGGRRAVPRGAGGHAGRTAAGRGEAGEEWGRRGRRGVGGSGFGMRILEDCGRGEALGSGAGRWKG